MFIQAINRIDTILTWGAIIAFALMAVCVLSCFLRSPGISIFCITAFIVVIVSMGVMGIDYIRETSSAPEQTEPTEEPVNLSVTYDEIYLAYKENEIAAKDKYQHKRYRITAKIDDIQSNGLFGLGKGADLLVERRVGNTIVYFGAYFEKDQRESIKKVKVGDTITFDGRCVSAGTFSECKIVLEDESLPERRPSEFTPYEQIYRDFNKNYSEAEALYCGNRYRVKAKVEAMPEDGMTVTFAQWIGGTEKVTLTAEFWEARAGDLESITPGSVVTFTGVCTGQTSFEDCELIGG